MDDEGLLRRLRAADPAGDDELSDWASSDAGRQVYERILARRQKPVSARSRNPRITRFVVAAGAAAVVVVAVALGLFFGLHGSARVASISPSTTAAIVQKAADRVEVLAHVLAIAEAGVQATENPNQVPGGPAAASAAQAQTLGIIGASERDWVTAHGPLGRATYALWLWRAFGDRLKQVKSVTFSDLDGLSDEVRHAVLGVAGAGILVGSPDGRFEPDRTLSQQEDRDSVKRLEQAFGLSLQ